MTKEKWTAEEELYLKNNYQHLSVQEISEYLNKSVKAVNNKASRMSLKKKKDWEAHEDAFLLDNYRTLGVNQCSKILNRTTKAISLRALRLNIRSEHRVLESEKEYLFWLSDNPEFLLLSEYLGTKHKSLHKHLECGHEWYTTPRSLKSSIDKGTGGCPYCGTRRKYSKVAIEWLNTFNNPNILHAENEGEQVISGYKVDGYDPLTNTVYEFHGDAYHGNLDIYSYDFYCHPYDKTITAEELWDKTFLKMKTLSEVATVVYIWENDFINKKPYCIF